MSKAKRGTGEVSCIINECLDALTEEVTVLTEILCTYYGQRNVDGATAERVVHAASHAIERLATVVRLAHAVGVVRAAQATAVARPATADAPVRRRRKPPA